MSLPSRTRHPTWEGEVAALFADPFWIDEGRRQEVAGGWKECMLGYGIDLSDFGSVRQSAVTVYDHLASRSMPLTTQESEFWPEPALEELRAWINEGCRRTADDPVDDKIVVPPPVKPAKLRVRRNILGLSTEELNDYRMRLDELQIADSSPSSPWQRLAYIHTDWCLHYQEAFLLWHRANVLYFEQMIGCPVPYWNFMSPHATEDGSPEAGIPQPFKDLTYIHPKTGEERPNPLRLAAAKDGCSKACVAQEPDARAEDCKYVARDPLLYTSGDDRRTERQHKLDLVAKFQEQVVFALQWPLFSTPQGTPGYPWANIQTFDPPPPDSDYPHRTDFDGLYEQPHDNFHGWVGPDMADNAYTAFDPIFWSYHSNIDRIFEEWNRAHPACQFTANVPLRPFVGPRAAGIDPANPEPYVYTTIGDMAADSRSLGYDYAPPVEPDVSTVPDEAPDYALYVAFGGIKCLRDTYLVDVFLNLSNPEPQDKHNHNKAHYVGRLTRLGMGVEDDRGRCLAWGVTRVLDASRTAHRLGILPPSEVTADLLVTDASTGRRVDPGEYGRLPGFRPTVTWVHDTAADSSSR